MFTVLCGMFSSIMRGINKTSYFSARNKKKKNNKNLAVCIKFCVRKHLKC